MKPSVPALTRDRLSHVDQSYVRSETIAAASSRLLAAQAGIELAAAWGDLVASVDGRASWSRWPPSTRGPTRATSNQAPRRLKASLSTSERLRAP